MNWALIAKYLKKETTEAEESELMADPETMKVIEEVSTWWPTDMNPLTSDDIIDSWTIVQGEVSGHTSMRKWWLSAAAAISFLLAASFFWFYDPHITISSGNRPIDIWLPDSSHVFLDSNSCVSYKQSFSSRDIQFSGRGFFDVRRDESRIFTVSTGDLDVRVLGTSFQLDKNTSSTEVVVASGRVEISTSRDTVVLDSLDKILLNGDQLVKNKVSNLNDLAWHTHSLSFVDAPLSEVFTILEKTFGQTIQLRNSSIGACRINLEMGFQKSSDVWEVLQLTVGLHYESNDNQITITSSKCAK